MAKIRSLGEEKTNQVFTSRTRKFKIPSQRSCIQELSSTSIDACSSLITKRFQIYDAFNLAAGHDECDCETVQELVRLGH